MHDHADNITGEQKLDVLLNQFLSNGQVNAVTKSSKDPDDAAGQKPLHYAAKTGVLYAARTLLLAGAKPSIKDNDGNTPLDLARRQLASVRARIMEHELFRTVTDLQSTVDLLERPLNLRTVRAIESDSPNIQMQDRFSRLGFQLQPSGAA